MSSKFETAINSHRVVAGKTTFILFEIQVQYASEAWLIRRRFSEFVSVRKELVKIGKDLPSLPKTWLPAVNSKDKAFVEQRRLKLNGFLRSCISDPEVSQSPVLHRFLGVVQPPPHTPLQYAFRQEFQSLLDPLFGVNQLVFDKDNNQVVTIAQDVYVLSRVDSFLSNLQMPWQEPSESVVPVGTLNLWSYDGESDNILLQTEHEGRWKPLVSLYFEVAASALAYHAPTRNVSVGLDDGRLYVYGLTADSFKVKQEIKECHSDRVTGMIYDPSGGLLFSGSKDKTLRVHDTANKSLLCTLNLEAPATSIALDNALSNVFIGLANGAVCIAKFDPQQHGDQRLSLLHTMSQHTGAVTALHFSEHERYLFSGSADNTVGIWKIEGYGDKKDITRSRTVGSLRGAPEAKAVRSLSYDPNKRQLTAGFEQGTLFVWELGAEGHEEVVRLDAAHKHAVNTLVHVPECNAMLSGGDDGKIRTWRWGAE